MVFAAVDIGSNTLRLLVAEMENRELRALQYDRVITRLARGLKEKGAINEGSFEHSIEVLKDFARTVERYNADSVRCVGTSALREASNAQEFIERAREASGLDIEVITGEDEAALTAAGVLSMEERPESFVIFDIGGGSTEVIYSAGKGKAVGLTKPMGAVKLLEDHIKTDPPSDTELGAIRADADVAFRALSKAMPDVTESGAVLIGTAGTACTLAAIDMGLKAYNPDKIQGHTLSLSRLLEMFDMLKQLSHVDRALVDGLEPERADLIIPGIILTISLMESLGFKQMSVSDRGLLEGILLAMAEGGIKSAS